MLALPSVTKQAANEGLQLWIFTVLPALLPYTVISSVLMELNAFSAPCRLIERITKRKLPENEIFTVICGCLCGCPIGAKIAAESYKKGSIKKSTAEFLMCAFNNLSPSFLINYVFVLVYTPFIQLTYLNKWLLFLIMISSSLLGALITHKIFSKSHDANYQATFNILNTAQKKPSFSKFFEDCILSAFEIQAKIGGYIILFTIVTNLFLYTLDLSRVQASVFGSILEITSGLGLFMSCNNHTINLPPYLIPALITALTAFGGICTIFQTKTAISGSGLSIIKYGTAKLISGFFAFVLYIFIMK